MSSFDKAFEHTVGLEGGYSDHPLDKGGPTMYGITEALARANGYTGDMKIFPLEKAKVIYKARYWDKLHLDDIAKLSESIAVELFDTSVNMGPATVGKFLQRALNCFTGGSLALDGLIGGQTISALNDVIIHLQGDSVILKMLNAQQCVRYMEIVEKNTSQAVFLKGWIDKRVQ